MRLTRREALRRLAGLVASAPALRVPFALLAPLPAAGTGWYGLAINPRSSWAPAGRPAPAGLVEETTVHVLVVHHSDSTNTYAAGQVPGLLRGFWNFHTGPEKRWPDVAYNFFVDRFGGVWEGRSGSLERPVAGSATGGNQGSSQLVCLVGNHATEPPSAAAVESLARLLAGLEDRYALSADPEATTSFVSNGSNRWKTGRKVTLRAIEGHRAVSMTSCPGDAAFALLPEVRRRVRTLRTGS
jgi:hypothetical protein